MTRFFCLLFVLAAGLPGPAARAQGSPPPSGGYRTAAAYHRRQPQPAGLDAFFPDKRGQVVVVVPHGTQKDRLRLSPDSLWGYVSNKGRTFRLFRGNEYRLEHADTLCVYSTNTTLISGDQRGFIGPSTHLGGQSPAGMHYYFSRGLNGLLFPLTVRYLREAYEASDPQFVAALTKMGFTETLTDVDRTTGLFRVTVLYRGTAAKP
jgi:hypothetical protein